MLKNGRRLLGELEAPVIGRRGSVVFCKLPLINAEHTGIYLGPGRGIIELDSDGRVREVSFGDFINGPNSNRFTGAIIYIICDDFGCPLCDHGVGERAESKIGSVRGYNLISDNCHQFTAGCILGDFENGCVTFPMVEDTIRNHYNVSGLLSFRKLDTNY